MFVGIKEIYIKLLRFLKEFLVWLYLIFLCCRVLFVLHLFGWPCYIQMTMKKLPKLVVLLGTGTRPALKNITANINSSELYFLTLGSNSTSVRVEIFAKLLFVDLVFLKTKQEWSENNSALRALCRFPSAFACIMWLLSICHAPGMLIIFIPSCFEYSYFNP